MQLIATSQTWRVARVEPSALVGIRARRRTYLTHRDGCSTARRTIGIVVRCVGTDGAHAHWTPAALLRGWRGSERGVPIAALSEPPSATGEFPADLLALTRHDLQQLAKRMGVRANQKSVDMVTELQALVPRRETDSTAERSEASAAERRSEQSAPKQSHSAVPLPSRPADKAVEMFLLYLKQT